MKSILQTDDSYCFLCGRPATDPHHIRLGNCSRKRAEQYCLMVSLCRQCHNAVHKNGIEKTYLQARGQMALEEVVGHEAYMELFGTDYIEKLTKEINEAKNVRTD